MERQYTPKEVNDYVNNAMNTIQPDEIYTCFICDEVISRNQFQENPTLVTIHKGEKICNDCKQKVKSLIGK